MLRTTWEVYEPRLRAMLAGWLRARQALASLSVNERVDYAAEERCGSASSYHVIEGTARNVHTRAALFRVAPTNACGVGYAVDVVAMSLRLPTLLEVLEGRSQSPVDVSAFSRFLQRSRNEDALLFWLAVQQHERLCTLYLLSDGYDKHDAVYTGEKNVPLDYFDLVTSAQSIHDHVLTPGAPQEILLPPLPRESTSLSHPSGSVEELLHLFDAQKRYVYISSYRSYIFSRLEAHHFPYFLQSHAFQNLSRTHSLVRVGLGWLVLWIAYSTAYSMVFLSARRPLRVWVCCFIILCQVLLPFLIGFYFLVSYWYCVDPILAFCGRSEMSPFVFVRVEDAQVRRYHRSHALAALLLMALLTAAMTVLFVWVPGYRL